MVGVFAGGATLVLHGNTTVAISDVNSNELKRWLKKHGCTFATHKGGSGHLTVYLAGRKTQLPMHGKKELGTGLVQKIKKDLGLKG